MTHTPKKAGDLPFGNAESLVSRWYGPSSAAIGILVGLPSLLLSSNTLLRIMGIIILFAAGAVLIQWISTAYWIPAARRIKDYPVVMELNREQATQLQKGRALIRRLAEETSNVGVAVESAYKKDGKYIISIDGVQASNLVPGAQFPCNGLGDEQDIATATYVGESNILGQIEFEFDGSPLVYTQIDLHHQQRKKYVPNIVLLMPTSLVTDETYEEKENVQ